MIGKHNRVISKKDSGPLEVHSGSGTDGFHYHLTNDLTHCGPDPCFLWENRWKAVAAMFAIHLAVLSSSCGRFAHADFPPMMSARLLRHKSRIGARAVLTRWSERMFETLIAN